MDHEAGCCLVVQLHVQSVGLPLFLHLEEPVGLAEDGDVAERTALRRRVKPPTALDVQQRILERDVAAELELAVEVQFARRV